MVKFKRAIARPGMSYLVPVGTHESHLELSDRMECLHLYLPPTLLDQSDLVDFDIDPAKLQIAYADGLADPCSSTSARRFATLLHRPRQPTDAMFVEGIQVALAAHLLANYTVDRWRPPEKSPSLDPRRLQRVLDYIEASLNQSTSGSRNWRLRLVSAPIIFPGCFARRPDCRRTAM